MKKPQISRLRHTSWVLLRHCGKRQLTQLHWAGHMITEMLDESLPKRILYSEFQGWWSEETVQRFLESFHFGLDPALWEILAQNHAACHGAIAKGTVSYEAQHTETAKLKSEAHKARSNSISIARDAATQFTYPHNSRDFLARFGSISHFQTHLYKPWRWLYSWQKDEQQQKNRHR